jgi:xanthine dehydrogenase molybdopterin-binding subunit B
VVLHHRHDNHHQVQWEHLILVAAAPGVVEVLAEEEVPEEVAVAPEGAAVPEEVVAEDNYGLYSNGISEVLISLRQTYFPSLFTNRLI